MQLMHSEVPFLGGETISLVLVAGSLPVLTAVLDMLQNSLIHPLSQTWHRSPAQSEPATPGLP